MRKKHIVIWLAPFLLLSPVWLVGKALFWGTPLLQFMPWWNWAWETLRGGHLPLWNPLLGMGAPLIANYQSALFYPPNCFYFLLVALGGPAAMAWGQAILVALHLAWAGIGMALLARRLRIGELGQVISGLAFSLSGYLVARAGFLSINACVAWLPWVILYSWKFVDGMAHPVPMAHPVYFQHVDYFKLVFVASMQLLAGHAQTTWYTWLLAAMWAGYWGWSESHASAKSDLRAGKPGRRFRVWLEGCLGILKAWLRLGTALVFACTLAAVQLGPTLEYLLQSQRSSAVNFDYAMVYSFWPWRLLTLFAPELFGNPARGNFWGYGNFWEDAVYLGILPVLLAVAAISRSIIAHRQPPVVEGTDQSAMGVFNYRQAAVAFLAVLIPVTLILALGQNTPVFPWLYRHIPTFSMFQAPARYMVWAEFSLALLAGFGADVWRRPAGRALYWTRLATAGAVAVSLGAGLAWYMLSRIPTLPEISQTFIRATALAGFWGLGAGVLGLLAPRQGESRAWSWGVILFVLGDLLFANWGVNPGVDLDLYRQAPPNVSEVRTLLDGHRLYLPAADERTIKFDRFLRFDTYFPGEEWSGLRAVLMPDVNLFYNLPSANNFDPLLPGRYARWMDNLATVDSQTRNKLLNLMDVGVVESVDSSQPYGVWFDPRNSLKKQPVFGRSLPAFTGEVGAPARFRWVSCAWNARDAEEAWSLLLDGQVHLENEVILEEINSTPIRDCKQATGATFQVISESPSQIRVRLKADYPGWLVISDVWYPGWSARVDWERTPIWRANYLFRAVEVPAGEHEIMMEYKPLSFWLGLGVSGVGWVLLGLSWKKGRNVLRLALFKSFSGEKYV